MLCLDDNIASFDLDIRTRIRLSLRENWKKKPINKVKRNTLQYAVAFIHENNLKLL